MGSCAACGAPLGSVLVCEACGALRDAGAAPSPFEVLGLPAAFAVDPARLRRRLLELSRRIHPDFFGAAEPAVRALAERNTAQLNTAHQLLADEARRADHLVAALGGPRESEERAMPPEFLQEVLEWSEAIEDARAAAPGSPARTALAALAQGLDAEHARLLARLSALLTPLPERGARALTEARQRLNAVRYLERARREIAELALPRPPAPAPR